MPKNRGFGLLEIVIATAIISGTLFSLSYVFLISNKLAAESGNKVRANFLAEEGLEALRLLRDQSWTSNLNGLNINTTYYLAFDAPSSAWGISASGQPFIDGLFDRTVTVENVNRDVNYNIASSGTNDPDTKKFNVSVAWSERAGTTTITVSTYLTDIFDN